MAKVKVLIVDDSGFFRRRIRDMLNADPGLEVIGEAADGREAVREVGRLRPDVVTMDIEMPVLDGISAVREIMKQHPTPVLMFSSLTFEGARATLDALEAGAVDFLPKRFSDISSDAAEARRQLQERVKAVGAGAQRAAAEPARPERAPRRTEPEPPPESARPRSGYRAPRAGDLDLVVIGASTGGPVALQKTLMKLPASFPVPLLLVQHMPANFTTAFAQRVNDMCAISVREAGEGDVLEPGQALLAPGGQHLGVRRSGGRLSVRLIEPREGQFYKPSVDIAFQEAAQACGSRLLGVVMTGMGSDGCEGARKLKGRGGHLWSQDRASSVIYGMPAAVERAGLTDQVLALGEIGAALGQLR